MKRKLSLLATAMVALCAWADLPVKLLNNSGGQFADGDIYVAIIGKQGEHQEIYYDLAATANEKRCVTRPLNTSVNTLRRDGHEWGFANIFTRMSDLRDHTIYLGNTFACRMFVAFKSPMYLHVHDAGGYAGADMNNPTDPNADIRWELIEFTYEPTFDYNTGQIWINTTRVDAFQYPMGLELYSKGNVAGSTPYIKRGEIVNYQTVINKWNSTLGGTAYKDCLYNLIGKDNLGGIIKQPSKVQSIKQAGLFNGYIDKVWNYFRSNTANINMGVLGRWEGRVYGDEFVLTCKEGTYWNPGEQAHIYGKPSTEDAIEGAGQFANGQAANDRQRAIDLTVQAMFCAAFNRGQFRTQTSLQNWDPESGIRAFSGGSEFPCNEYVKFFHNTDITASNGRTYAFAYDDTFDQSATCYSTAPTSVTVTIGGFVNGGGTGGTETPSTPAGISAAPKPGQAAGYVKSIFSGSYNSITPGITVGQWGQSTNTTVQNCGGDDAYRLENFNYMGLQLVANDGTVNVTDMEKLHIDIYAINEMDINIYPISLNPTNDTKKVTRHLSGGKWNSFDIALSDFAGVDFTKLGQFKFDGGSGQTLYIDNIYFWKNAPASASVPAAPKPGKDARYVKSLFSGAYSALTPELFAANWGQAAKTTVEACGGDNAFKITNFDYQGFQLSGNASTYNVKDMEYIHIDFYALNEMVVNFYPISLNPTKDTDKVAIKLPAKVWGGIDLPLSMFGNVDFTKLGQFKFDGGSGQTFYIDNVYLWKNAPVSNEPSDVPTPSHGANSVRSIFSSAYNAAIATNVGGWGQSTDARIVQIANKNVYKLTNFNYLGLEFENNTGRLDVSACTHMHVDYWTPDGSAFGFTPISPGNERLWTAPTVNKRAWNSYDVPLSYFNNVNLSDLFQVKFDLGNGCTGYIANVYFYNANGGSATPSAACTYNFGQNDGQSLRGGYTVQFSTSGTTVKVKAKFSGDYSDSPGAYFWTLYDNGGLAETQMTREGEWYTIELHNQAIGSQLKYQIMLPIAGGRAITKSGAYYVVGQGCANRVNGYNAIDETRYEGRFGITPNPASDVAAITVDGAGTITVYDTNGRRMLSMPIDGEAIINVSSWTRGMYLVRFTSAAGQSATARLLH